LTDDVKLGRRAGLVLAAILALGLAVRLYVISLDLKVLLPNFLSDDFFCYLKLCRNIASGLGVSFDGVTTTNGFHPLYAALLTVVYSFTGSDLELPIRIALLFLSVFEALTGVLVYKMLLLPAFGKDSRSALVGCLFWMLNPFVLTGTFYGIETAMSVFFVTLALYRYLKMRNAEREGNGYVALGAIIGFAILARTDSVFALIAIAADLLARGRLRGMILTAGSAMLVSSPWFVWNYLTFGMLQQESGLVVTYLTASQAGSFLSAQYLAAKAGVFYLSMRILAMFAASMALPVGFAVALHLLKKINLAMDYRKLLLNVVVLFSLLLVLYYPALLWAVTRRYYQPILMVFALAIGLLYKPIASLSDKRIPAAFVLLLIINLAAASWFYFIYRPSAQQAWHLDLYDTALWLRENTNASDRLGGFNFAIIGYFSNRTVIDTIGVMNDEAYHALVERRLFSYIRERNIRYLVDDEKTFDSISPFMGDADYMQHLRLVYKKPLKERPDEHIVVYEVVANESQ
jgi:hypothetical protein